MRTKTLAWALALSVLATAVSSAQVPQGSRTNTVYGKLPLTFESNQGQSASQVKFLSRGNGYTAYLTADGIVLSLRASTVVATTSSSELSAATTVQFTLEGATKFARVVGEDPQPGRVNYFFGNDPAKWLTNVSTYGRVRYKDVYPGIDLLYYGNHRQLEYDFELRPGADPRQIQFEIRGARRIGLDSEGNLVLRLGNGEIHFQTPIVYQESEGQRTPVGGAYVVTDSTHIAFRIARYDSTKPLVIDPVLVYSTYLGGSGMDQPAGMAVDSTGSVYVGGYTNSVDFPLATLGSLPTNANHVFLAKLDPPGSHVIYTDYIGGNGEDYGVGLVLDRANEVYVTGSTTSSNFPVVKAYQSQQPGPYTGFLTKVSADGSSLLYSTYLGGSALDQPASIAIDRLGQVHVAGFTASQNFPVANAYQSTASANQGGIYGDYGFLTKFSADGSSLIYSTYLAGNSVVAQACENSPCWPAPYNAVNALAVDANGNAYVAGTTNTNNFPVTPATFLTTNSTQQDAEIGFVSKFTSAGGLDYSTYFYQSSGAPLGITAIAVDNTGSAYITGYADSDGTFPITSTSICDPSVHGWECGHAFVTKFDPTASTLLYSTFLGPNNYAVPAAIALEATGNAYVLGSTSNPMFQTTDAIEAYTNEADVLLVELDPGATTQLFSTYLGGSGNDAAVAMALDAANDIYIAGYTNSTDLPLTSGVFQGVPGGGTDAFVMKIGAGSAPMVSLSPSVVEYPAQRVGSTSQPQRVVLHNMSNLPLTISSISATGDFAEKGNCGTGLPPAGSCGLSVTFTPAADGSRSGSILINDSAVGSPQQVSLEGSGVGSAMAPMIAVGGTSVTPASLTFPATQVGVSSAAQTVTLTNQSGIGLNFASVQITGDYAQTNNCPGTLASGFSCTFSIIFTPAAAGSRAGTLAISDNAANSPQVVPLSGTGSDFSLASSPSTATVMPGATASYILTVTPVGGAFNNVIKLACSGAPQYSTCSLSPTSTTPGSNPTSVTVTISTTGTTAQATPPVPAGEQPRYAIWIGFQGFGFLGLVVVGSGWSKKKTDRLVGLVLLGMLIFMTACAGGTGISPPTGTPPGTYTITVTGTAGALQHSLPLTLTVQ